VVVTQTGSLTATETIVDLDGAPTAAPTRRRAPASRPGPDASPPIAARDVSASAPASEDATTSPASDPALLLPHLDSAAAIHLAEAANLARPVLKYLATPPNHRLVPFDRAWLVTLHREMFGDVWAWAGRFRDTPIDGASRPSEIEGDLRTMLADRAAAIASTVPAIERSARLLAHAWSIRPFLHGNGRWSRLLVDIDLALFREPTIAWPLDERARPVLRQALEAGRSGDRGPLEAMLRRWQRR
jgi:fido (protein-threonine AMPylation protein)